MPGRRHRPPPGLAVRRSQWIDHAHRRRVPGARRDRPSAAGRAAGLPRSAARRRITYRASWTGHRCRGQRGTGAFRPYPWPQHRGDRLSGEGRGRGALLVSDGEGELVLEPLHALDDGLAACGRSEEGVGGDEKAGVEIERSLRRGFRDRHAVGQRCIWGRSVEVIAPFPVSDQLRERVCVAEHLVDQGGQLRWRQSAGFGQPDLASQPPDRQPQVRGKGGCRGLHRWRRRTPPIQPGRPDARPR